MSDSRVPPPASFRSVFGMDAEQAVIRSAVRKVLGREASLSVDGRTGSTPDRRDQVWTALTRLGLPGMLVPTAQGGSGLGHLDTVVALEEAGRVLLDAPLTATLMAVSAILIAADDLGSVERLLGRVAAGDCTATLALTEQLDSVGDMPRTRATSDARGWVVTGDKKLVMAGDTADVVVASAMTDDGPGLFVMERDAGGLRIVPVPGLDLTRTFADLVFDDVPATRLDRPGRPELIDRVLGQAIVLLAAESIGASQQALDLTLEHARTRVQYDRPIGSFQAIKHRCADMLIEIEYARSAAYYAAWAISSGPEELSVLTGVLKTCVAEAGVSVAETMIQVFGGMGFTWEHVAHLFYRRALSDRLLFGSPEQHQDRVASTLGF